MRYLRTTLATDWPKNEPWQVRVAKTLLFFVPEANPDYESVLHLVREWFVEFDDDDRPLREIGLDENGSPVICGPNDRNIGFWLDAHISYSEFKGTEISAELFEATWKCRDS